MVSEKILIIKKMLLLLAAAVAMLQTTHIQPKPTQRFGGAANGESLFAEIDANGTVLRVLVVDQAYINTGKLGDPSHWVKTSYDGSTRKNYAGIGYIYDKDNDAFIQPKPNADAELDTTTFKWKQPANAVKNDKP